MSNAKIWTLLLVGGSMFWLTIYKFFSWTGILIVAGVLIGSLVYEIHNAEVQ